MSLSLATVSLGSVLAVAEEGHRELPMPAVAYGGLALVAFGLLLAFLWTFRGTAQKIGSPQAGSGDHGAAGHGSSGHGSSGHGSSGHGH